MRFAALLLGVALCATAARAQVRYAGTIGIFDDLNMTRTSGVMDGMSKELFIGVVTDPPLETEYTGFQFSISGLQPFVHVVEVIGTPTVVLGDIAAPLDTLTGTGGIAIAWPTCMTESVFLKLRLFAASPPENHVLRVHKLFPPSNPYFPFPQGSTCDVPCLCPRAYRGGSYVLNPNVAVEPGTWSAIKRLYAPTGSN
jgi:hypothetical protein